MSTITNTEIGKVGTRFRQTYDAFVLNVAASLNVDLPEVFAVSRQKRKGFVGNVGTAFADEDLEFLATVGQGANAVGRDHVAPGDVKMQKAGTSLSQGM